GPLAHANVLFTVPQGAAKYLLNRRGDVDDQVTLRTDAEGYAQAWVLVPVDFAATNVLAVAAGTPANFTRVRMRVLVDDYSGTGTLQWNTNAIPQPWAVATRTKLLDPVGPPAGVSAFSEVAGFGEGDVFLSTELFLEPYGYSNSSTYLRLHNTEPSNYYQLLSTNLLTNQPGEWTLGQIITGATDTNVMEFDPVFTDTETKTFFRVHQAPNIVSIEATQNAYEPRAAIGDAGEIGIFYLSLGNTNPTTNVTVYYRISGSASNGVDYSNLSGVVTIPKNPGFTEIHVLPIEDNLNEGTELVVLTIIQTNDYLIVSNESVAALTISDNSALVSVQNLDNPTAIEPGGPPGAPGVSASFIFYRTDERATNAPLPVYYRVTGTASNGVDYTLFSGVQTFPAGIGGVVTTNLVVVPLADNLAEGIETVTVTLIPTNTYQIDSSASNATINIADSSTTISIGAVTNAIEPYAGTGFSGQTGYLYVSRSDSRGLYPALTVSYQVSGTASNGVDYSFLSGTVSFASNTTANSTNILVVPLGDNLLEGVETVIVTLSPVTTYLIDSNNASAVVNIFDSSSNLVSIAALTNAVEPNSAIGDPGRVGAFLVSRSDARGIYPALPVSYQISGTASNGIDYSNLTGTVTIASNALSNFVFITAIEDGLFEGNETVTLTLTQTSTYGVNSGSASATITISDTTTTAGITAATNAVETNSASGIPGRVGAFFVTRTDTRNFYPAFEVRYLVSGTASNGVDYSTINGIASFAAGSNRATVLIQTLEDLLIEGDETVTLTLIQTNGAYLIATNSTATIIIQDNVPLIPVVTNLAGPIGIDYHAPSNSLIISYNYNTGLPFNFARIYTNGGLTIVTNWSTISNLADEVKLATVKATLNGFTNGEMYFSSGGGIGKLAADVALTNLTWAILTNATVTNALPIRGSLYVDQTGVFSNQLIAVASDPNASTNTKGVWRVDAQAHPTLLANLATRHLEGVITLTNDVAKWGPWAGKIITGDEDFLPNPVIYTIATNGVVTTNDTTNLVVGGIHPEDFDIIPTNQNLYACDSDRNMILKLPAVYLTNFVGDLLITQAGEQLNKPAQLFIVHWDSGTTNFIIRSVTYIRSDNTLGHFEHVTFSPIELPDIVP
ncbi:MAG: hypothetical protein HY301_11155, partial [Verrucomicrobia bacterium]|nr:hypothetical protein [Verrucomicrobiota bacterium]